MTDARLAQRQKMVREQLLNRGISDPAVIHAMETVPRHLFVPRDMRAFAYEDGPLSIGQGQTISQPYIVAYMVQAAKLRPESRVLEIGTGSGYAAAVASFCAKEVYTIERLASLAESAQQCLDELNYPNIHVLVGDGSQGWPEHAPFDAVIVTAGAPVLPESLAEQIRPGGCLVIPVGDRHDQELLRYTRSEDGELIREKLLDVRFVPLIGVEGWQEGRY